MVCLCTAEFSGLEMTKIPNIFIISTEKFLSWSCHGGNTACVHHSANVDIVFAYASNTLKKKRLTVGSNVCLTAGGFPNRLEVSILAISTNVYLVACLDKVSIGRKWLLLAIVISSHAASQMPWIRLHQLRGMHSCSRVGSKRSASISNIDN